MKEQFTSFDIAQRLERLGFNEKCLNIWFVKSKEISFKIGFASFKNSQLDAISYISAPLYQQVFDWFQSTYGLSGEILKQGIHPPFNKPYWWYMIQNDKGEDLSKWQERHQKILEKTYQKIEGKFINDKLLLKHIFEDKFAFKNINNARQACIEQMIKIAENETSKTN